MVCTKKAQAVEWKDLELQHAYSVSVTIFYMQNVAKIWANPTARRVTRDELGTEAYMHGYGYVAYMYVRCSQQIPRETE